MNQSNLRAEIGFFLFFDPDLHKHVRHQTMYIKGEVSEQKQDLLVFDFFSLFIIYFLGPY